MHTFLATVPEFRGKSRHGLYGDSILELDWAVGEILGELRRLGMEDNTLVYLTSDNGGHLEERGAAGDVQGGYNGELKGMKRCGTCYESYGIWRGRCEICLSLSLVFIAKT